MVPKSTVNFTVTGGGDLTYKWQQDGADLCSLPEGMSGETPGVLQIDDVSNAAGPTPSKRARLTVRKCLYLVQSLCILKIGFVLDRGQS